MLARHIYFYSDAPVRRKTTHATHICFSIPKGTWYLRCKRATGLGDVLRERFANTVLKSKSYFSGCANQTVTHVQNKGRKIVSLDYL